MNFTFTGKLGYGEKPIRDGKTKSGIDYKSFNGSVKADTNTVFVESFGMNNSEIKTMDADKNKITVAAADRFDKDVVDKVASWRKNIYNDGNERKAFIATYDFVVAIESDLEKLKDATVTITGQTQKNIYNGNISDRFVINNIYVTDADTKPVLKVTSPVFWTKEDIDASDFKEDKKIYINGYTYEYLDKDNGNKYFPIQVVLDCNKINFENEKHIGLLQFKLKQLNLAYDNGKIVNNNKAKVVYKLPFVMNYVNGAEEIPFDASQLTKNQQEAIALGLNTIDDFKPKGQIYGNRIKYYKLVNFDLTGDYADGAVNTEMTISEFDDDKYVIPAAKEEDFMVAPEDDADIDDLFS